MIVADANVLVYFAVTGPDTSQAELWQARDRDWIGPPILRSELRNVLITTVRRKQLQAGCEFAAYHRACAVMRFTPDPDPDTVMGIAIDRGLTCYDAEYVATARQLGLKLLTDDRRVVNVCKDVAVDFRLIAEPLS